MQHRSAPAHGESDLRRGHRRRAASPAARRRSLLGRAGRASRWSRNSPTRSAFKRICSHFIQASAVPAIERLGLLEPIEAAGGVRPASTHGPTGAGSSRRRERGRARRQPAARGARPAGARGSRGRDPRRRAAAGPERRAAAARGRHAFAASSSATARATRRELRARLAVGADGRDSRIAELAGCRRRRTPHGRFAYGGYFEGPPPKHAPDGSIWMLDPHWAAAFPTDERPHLLRGDADQGPPAGVQARPGGGAASTSLADAARARRRSASRALVEPVLGKIDMTNRVRKPVAPGLALVGDAALATDPLFGVGCGWAFQSAEWLRDASAPALQGEEPLEQGPGALPPPPRAASCAATRS